MSSTAGGIDVTPTLPVVDMADAIRFYEAAGLDVERYDDGFAGLDVTQNEDMPWGMHEFTLTDPSGNHIRVGCRNGDG